ncbi:uncharacterized protein METZ01_LOCUS252488 [marine metagenome]|uniref:Uncharacterized protein n=1 Tax=marine metagenome TaxID=408172 RepID=A0A382IIQ6_9ZZZZ
MISAGQSIGTSFQSSLLNATLAKLRI